MIVVDEYLAIWSVLGELPPDLPDEPLAITTSAHWRILQRIHAPGAGQLSHALRDLSPAGRAALRRPPPGVIEILDPRPLLDEAASIAAGYGAAGWHVAETLTAGLHLGGTLWFGTERNIGRRMREIADDLGITIVVVT